MNNTIQIKTTTTCNNVEHLVLLAQIKLLSSQKVLNSHTLNGNKFQIEHLKKLNFSLTRELEIKHIYNFTHLILVKSYQRILFLLINQHDITCYI